ncbi:AI-2E family transporter [Patescibacteria group bacterium]|nr:MAG: AI-2E family transporter [Patescibacteria group bacterium]
MRHNVFTMKMKLDIETRVFIRFSLVILGFFASLFAVYQMRSALLLLAVSLFLALALNPPVSFLAKRLPGNSRVGATAIAYLMVLVMLGSFIVLVVPPVIEQSAKFASSVPGLIDDMSEGMSIFDKFIDEYGLRGAVDQAIVNAKGQAASIAANLGNTIVSGATATFSGIANMAFILVLTFLMLVESPMWIRRMWDLYDDEDRLNKHKAVVTQMYKVVTGFVIGQLVVATIAGISTIIFILTMSVLFGLPANLAVPLAVIIFLTDMIPMIGSTIGAVLVTIVLILNAPIVALIFVIYFLIFQQIENNFISPMIQSKSVDLSALLILSAVLIGITLGGLFGGLVAIPVAGCLRVLLMYHLDNQKRLRESGKKKSKKGSVKSKKEA